ncbi:hypothetical protein EI94DRAFT_1753609 [Lactarius quietus]|nr:hypothetical protein EI94DRAFT_1753609 [Lactarius quietus]
MKFRLVLSLDRTLLRFPSTGTAFCRDRFFILISQNDVSPRSLVALTTRFPQHRFGGFAAEPENECYSDWRRGPWTWRSMSITTLECRHMVNLFFTELHYDRLGSSEQDPELQVLNTATCQVCGSSVLTSAAAAALAEELEALPSPRLVCGCEPPLFRLQASSAT